jgi:hypothetical protein
MKEWDGKRAKHSEDSNARGNQDPRSMGLGRMEDVD